MNTRSFFGRVWQDSRRSMPSPSVGPMSAAPTLPVFSQSARAPAEARPAVAVTPMKTETTRAQTSRPDADGQNTVNRRTGKSPTAVAKANARPTTVVFESLRFEPVPNASWSIRENSRESSQTSSALAGPGPSLAQDARKPHHLSSQDSAEPVAAQAAEWPGRATDNSAGPIAAPSAVSESSLPGQSKDALQEAAPGEIAAPNTAVEKTDIGAAKPDTNKKTSEAAPAVPIANLHKKRGAPTLAQPGPEPVQPPGLHIGEVRIRLVEEPKETSPRRTSPTLTESDSRRLLRSL